MNYSADQIQNGETIIGVAKSLGLGTNAQVIGIMTALDESTLRNVDYGDSPGGVPSSSRGLFQQIAAWGPLADRENPVKAATMFYTGGQAGQRGLLDISGWAGMNPWNAAQSVQQSEFSDGSNYHAQYQAAVDFVNTYGTSSAPPAGSGASGPDIGPSFTANGVTIGDATWSTYLDDKGYANFPGINIHGKGVTAFPGNRMLIQLGDGTQIAITPNDDLTAVASAEHMAKDGKQISRIDFTATSQVTDYAGPDNQSSSGDPGQQTGGGAVADPALGIPDFLKSAPGWVADFLTGIGMRLLYVVGGGLLIVLALYFMAQQAKPGVQAAAAPALNIIKGAGE